MQRTTTHHKRLSYDFLSVMGAEPGNQVFGASYAFALKGGAVIGSSGKFPAGPRMVHIRDVDALSSYFTVYGPWLNRRLRLSNRFLGLKFIMNGEIHFGWARLTVGVVNVTFLSAQLAGYAYETEAGRSIVAGQTQDASQIGEVSRPPLLDPPFMDAATLGMLAIGAPGLDIWRREESTPAQG